ncbi:MAG: hypothetical protein K2L19_00060 [Eubacterium sp.]|nr:hypothetical protein [Eubacterium sp.]
MKQKQILKISISFLVIVGILVAVILCGRSFGFLKSNIANTKVDLGTSEIYSEQDLQAAADVILKEIGSWSSVKEVYTISYCEDERASAELGYCQMLKDENYVQCVVFESSFISAGSSQSGGFNPNSLYEDWQWFLARTADGEWELLTWGY